MPRQVAHWNKEFDRLSSMSDSAIYRELSLKVQLRGLRPGRAYSVSGEPKHGHSWVERKLSGARRSICNSPKIRGLIAGGDYTSRDLFLVLVDVLSSLHFYVPVGTVAMIVARRGLKKLCGIERKGKQRKQ